MRLVRASLLCLLLGSFSVTAFTSPIQPEPDSGWQDKHPARGTHGMVAAAHPAAVQAGLSILQQGGNALDALVATQMALNVAEPQASGIGGGGFLLYYDAASKKVFAYDGRETAPRAMPENAFLDEKGRPLPLLEAVRGGKSVGVPGILAMLEAAHRTHGKLAWKALFAPAITLAEHGVATSPRLRRTVEYASHLKGIPAFDAAFHHADGSPPDVGEARPNPQLAKSFRLIAEKGAEPFYRGELADAIADAVKNAGANPGYLRKQDLERYTPRRREPLCIPYRHYKVCSFGPPAGGLTVLEILGILAHFDMQTPASPEAMHLLLEAEKLSFADRESYLADPDFVRVPVKGLLAPQYLTKRARLIDPQHAMKEAKAGQPDKAAPGAPAPAVTERPSTTHVSIVDAQGNAASLTSSIEHSFGSGLMAGGFLLNNQLTDFSFLPRNEAGEKVANRVEPGKRPRSAMSPTLVFDAKGHLRLVIGSPGGARIIPYVAQALVAVLDWHMPLQEALNMPHVLSLKGPAELEEGKGLEPLGKELEALGHKVVFTPLNSGLHGVGVGADETLTGAADPRRDGAAAGY